MSEIKKELIDNLTKELIDNLTKELADEGKLIEAGWAGYKLAVLPKNASEIQISECRLAFFVGCQHLYGSIMSMLDPGPNETPNDLNRMELIDKELRHFFKEFKEQKST